eukprot:TRINITY_DN3037_c0_g2_i1.p1 TRINITY_DN3037_c0_g2~~TRINITY_DN3037_c0_g2_i1.p1  ORF type:complete len:359 (+),score=94.94 TRINITY_DN3037_c0_g2_i1:167-1243(+)
MCIRDRVSTQSTGYLRRSMETSALSSSANFLTLTRFLMDLTADKELTILMGTLALACKATSRACAHAGIAGLLGQAGDQNASGDDQKKLDVLSNDIFVNALMNSGTCAVLVSEENDDPIVVEDPNKRGSFCVAFDPLDGSSNIDCNVSTGTIFAVYKKETEGVGTAADILRTGEDIVAAGYCMYGAATELVLCFKGEGVNRFALDMSLGEFIHFERMGIPEGGGKKIYSCNEGNSSKWDPAFLKAVDHFRETGYSARYVGSMVADVHRTLLYGGIFMYPADSKSKNGKLRVLYEGFPMALIVEECGGLASTGMFKGAVHRMLELVPTDIHERCPVIVGSVRDVKYVLDLYDMGEAAFL